MSDIHMDINLDFMLAGVYRGLSGGGLEVLKTEFQLKEMLFPFSWSIPKILIAGSATTVQVSYALEWIEGDTNFRAKLMPLYQIL